MEREYMNEKGSNNIWDELKQYEEEVDYIEDKETKEKVLVRMAEIRKELLAKGFKLDD